MVIYIDMNKIIVVKQFLFIFENQDSNVQCLEMTYMFENPTYHRIAMPNDIENRYPRYSLYSYCEGVRCEAHRRNQFSGIEYCF